MRGSIDDLALMVAGAPPAHGSLQSQQPGACKDDCRFREAVKNRNYSYYYYASIVFNKVETNLILHISSGSGPFISRLPPTTLPVPAATTVPPSAAAIPAATISTAVPAASVSAAAELR